MRKKLVLRELKILDVGAIFVDGHCYMCGINKTVTAVWISLKQVFERQGCYACIKKYAHPKDLLLYHHLWYLQYRKQVRPKTLKNLEDLCERYPKRRFFPILLELMQLGSNPHKAVIQAIERMHNGLQPTKPQYRFITEYIRGYRDKRTGKRYQYQRTEYIPFYSSTGATGFL